MSLLRAIAKAVDQLKKIGVAVLDPLRRQLRHDQRETNPPSTPVHGRFEKPENNGKKR
jgi:hypothetical protein